MKRYIGYVEQINPQNNTCKVRIPSLDGFDVGVYRSTNLMNLNNIRTPTDQLEDADIPYHLQGLRVKDIVYCLDSEQINENLTILGFFGSTY